MKNTTKEFNLIIAGVGGQGLITLLKVLAEAAVKSGYEVRTSELHGLSQRGGNVEVHLRFGKNIYSPLVRAGNADLIIGLEAQEALTVFRYGAKNKTVFLLNKFFQPIGGKKLLEEKEILTELKKVAGKAIFIDASRICREKLGIEVVSGVSLLGYAVYQGLLPLEPKIVRRAIKENIPKEFLEINLKAFDIFKN